MILKYKQILLEEISTIGVETLLLTASLDVGILPAI